VFVLLFIPIFVSVIFLSNWSVLFVYSGAFLRIFPFMVAQENVVSYWLNTIIVESHKPAVARQQPANKTGELFPAESMLMAARATLDCRAGSAQARTSVQSNGL
jgi:hypothetical protein